LKLRVDAPQPAEKGRVLRWAAWAVAAGLCIWAAAQADVKSWLVLAAFAAAGTLLYAVSRWRLRARSPIYGAKNLTQKDA
jgi:hypothetical protein